MPRASFTLQNGIDAKNLNAQFATLTPSSPCTSGTNACVGTAFAQCANGQFVTFPCNTGLITPARTFSWDKYRVHDGG
ncbi:hypothetical protein DICSQDRAFT_169565 [Dichomitus squalens LYAD-421 SS1]|uniref:Carbohydrate-binding module family 19 domain-containing protein n=1 Tax=Dichomitus squalens (strain LYAD-421) TaxID=732165 RepID=R7T0W0_DICSQ|nr:uncharacterized protein DICSQDRAFT_169565 [Dichomitus squalens LYAD-421 SS1]EJF61991.1 hypothetical protein DICSQDRAFT_169565 [Dichomitus squalens LYAD-421 SS1]